MNGVTCLVTSLTQGSTGADETDMGISSLIDTWFQLRDIELGGERTRGLYLIKSRGMGHSNQVREFIITAKGIDLVPVALGPDGVLTGSARMRHEDEQRAQTMFSQQEAARRRRDLERKRQLLDAEIQSLRAAFASEEEETHALLDETTARVDASRAVNQRSAERRTGTRGTTRTSS
jgi:circadian clock protein KaiC